MEPPCYLSSLKPCGSIIFVAYSKSRVALGGAHEGHAPDRKTASSQQLCRPRWSSRHKYLTANRRRKDTAAAAQTRLRHGRGRTLHVQDANPSPWSDGHLCGDDRDELERDADCYNVRWDRRRAGRALGREPPLQANHGDADDFSFNISSLLRCNGHAGGRLSARAAPVYWRR